MYGIGRLVNGYAAFLVQVSFLKIVFKKELISDSRALRCCFAGIYSKINLQLHIGKFFRLSAVLQKPNVSTYRRGRKWSTGLKKTHSEK